MTFPQLRSLRASIQLLFLLFILVLIHILFLVFVLILVGNTFAIFKMIIVGTRKANTSIWIAILPCGAPTQLELLIVDYNLEGSRELFQSRTFGGGMLCAEEWRAVAHARMASDGKQQCGEHQAS